MKRLGCIALLCALLISCSETNVIAPTPLKPFTAEAEIKSVWSNHFDRSTEVVAKKRSVSVGTWFLTVTDVRGYLALYSRIVGERLWKIQYDQAFGAQGLIEDHRFYGSSLKGYAVAVDLTEGTLLWEQSLVSGIEAAPAFSEGYIVYHLHDGRLVALQPDTGAIIWQVRTNVPALSLLEDAAPLIDEGRVYLGLANGHVMAFDLKTGDVVWDKPIVLASDLSAGSNILNILGPLILQDGVIYTASFHDRVVAMSEKDGTVLWDRNIPSSEHVVLVHDALIVVDQEDQIYSLNVRTGETLWTQKDLRGRVVKAAAALEHGLLIADSEGYLHALSLEDGHFIARYSLPGGAPKQEPVVFDGILYLLSSSGQLQALNVRPL